jgi:hypothetical protein
MATATHLRRAGTRRAKTEWRATDLAPLTGVGVFLLGLAGLIVWEGPADRPEYTAPPRVILTYFHDRDTVILGGLLLALSAGCFLWFLGSLREILRHGEGGVGRLSAVAYGGGVVAAALVLLWPAANVLGALYASQLSPESAKTIFLFGNAFAYPLTIAAAVLLTATGIVALRSAALPRWLAWLTLALAVWLVIPPIGGAAGNPENPAVWTGMAALTVVPLWTAITALVLVLQRRSRELRDPGVVKPTA